MNTEERKLRLRELSKQSDVIREEMDILHRENRVEESQKLLGRFFKQYIDSEHKHWVYLSPTTMDDYGYPMGDLFKVYFEMSETNGVWFNNPSTPTHIDKYFYNIHYLTEISKDEYNEVRYEHIGWL